MISFEKGYGEAHPFIQKMKQIWRVGNNPAGEIPIEVFQFYRSVVWVSSSY